jgi:hypothetical protein
MSFLAKFALFAKNVFFLLTKTIDTFLVRMLRRVSCVCLRVRGWRRIRSGHKKCTSMWCCVRCHSCDERAFTAGDAANISGSLITHHASSSYLPSGTRSYNDRRQHHSASSRVVVISDTSRSRRCVVAARAAHCC